MPDQKVLKPSVKLTEIELIDRMLLVGPPGIGKTTYIKLAAKKEAETLGRIFVDIRDADEDTIKDIMQHPERYYVFLRVIAPHVFPEDISLPKHIDNHVVFVPPLLLRILTLHNIYGVLFLDEISNVQRDDQLSMLFSLILEKEVAWNIKLSDGIKIIAAANDSQWSELARPLPLPLRNRLIIIHIEPPSIEEWVRFMDETYGDDAWDRFTATYLSFYPEDFIKQPPEGDGFTAFPTPRSWTQLALLLRHVKESMRDAIVYGTIGPEVAPKFIMLVREMSKMSFEDILKRLREDPKAFDGLKTSEKILIVHYLASHHKEYSDIIAELPDEWIVTIVMLIPMRERLTFLSKMPSVKKLLKKVAELT